MADYYTPTVIDPMIPLAAMLPIERMFLAKVFNEELDDKRAYYFSEFGPNDLVYLPNDDVRGALEGLSPDSSCLTAKLAAALDEAAEEDGSYIELNLCGDLWAEVLQDIVRRSPDLDDLTVTMAFTCSKMRPDGFGGLAMLITATEIRTGSTSTLFDQFYAEAKAKGEIGHGHP